MGNTFSKLISKILDLYFDHYEIEVKYSRDDFDKQKHYKNYYDVCRIVNYLKDKYEPSNRLDHIKVTGYRKGKEVIMYNKIYNK